MRKLLIAGGFAVSALAMPAQAQVSIQFTPNSNLVGPNQTLINQFMGAGPSPTPLAGGTNAFTYFSDTGGQAILEPAEGIDNNTTDNGFGAVLAGGSYTFNVAASVVGAAQVFSFLIGTLDTFNSVTLNFVSSTGATSSQTLNGFAIAGLLGQNQSGGRVTYDAQGGPAITSVTFASSSNSFEFDDLAAAAPEPATWAMMILGFGLAGAALRRRRRTSAGTWAIA